MAIVIDSTKDSADIVNQNLQGVRQSAQLMAEIRARQQEMQMRKYQVAAEYAKAGMNPPPGLLDTMLPSQQPGLLSKIGSGISSVFGGGQQGQTQPPTQMPASQLPSQSGVISPTGMTRDQFIQANMQKLPPGLLNPIGQQEYASKFGKTYDESLTSQKTAGEVSVQEGKNALDYQQNVLKQHPEIAKFPEASFLFKGAKTAYESGQLDPNQATDILSNVVATLGTPQTTFDRNAFAKVANGNTLANQYAIFANNVMNNKPVSLAPEQVTSLMKAATILYNARAEQYNQVRDKIGRTAPLFNIKSEQAQAGLEPGETYDVNSIKNYSLPGKKASGTSEDLSSGGGLPSVGSMFNGKKVMSIKVVHKAPKTNG